MGKILDFTGERYGKLVAIRRAGANKHGVSMWLCRCDCGVEKIVSSMCFRAGKTKSCGCHRSDVLCAGRAGLHAQSLRHGKSNTREHRIWQNILHRCLTPTAGGYERYGGRGVKVCDRWQGKSGFESFLADMGPAPSRSHTVDRIDNDGNYEPENCRWATPKQQATNRRNNKPLEFRGEVKLMCEWCALLGIHKATLSGRLKRGWSVEKALGTPSRSSRASAG